MLKNWNWLSAMSAVCVLSVSAPDNADAQDTTPHSAMRTMYPMPPKYGHKWTDIRVGSCRHRFIRGASPHGKFLRMFSSDVTVDEIARPIIVKENYGGPGVSAKAATDSPEQWLKAVTIMLQREAGYDDNNENWFWMKYAPDGSVMKNPKGMQLAGRVAKGMPAGCISCHLSADGGDYLYFND